MTSALLQTYISRTDAKLRYATIHAGELETRIREGMGDDFDRAHYESFFFHLFGARDSLLQELNIIGDCGVDEKNVRMATLLQSPAGRNGLVPGLHELRQVEEDNGGWLWLAKTMRNKSAHRYGNPVAFYAGGERDGQVHFRHPGTGESLNENVSQTLRLLLTEMSQLVVRLRQLRNPHTPS
jgi:hypothetical protein